MQKLMSALQIYILVYLALVLGGTPVVVSGTDVLESAGVVVISSGGSKIPCRVETLPRLTEGSMVGFELTSILNK